MKIFQEHDARTRHGLHRDTTMCEFDLGRRHWSCCSIELTQECDCRDHHTDPIIRKNWKPA